MSCCSGPGIPETVLYLDHYPRAVSAPNGESSGLSTPSKVFLLHRAGVLPISSHEKLNEWLGSLAPEVSAFEASSKALGVPTSKSDSTSRCGLGLCSALHRNQSVAKLDRAYIRKPEDAGAPLYVTSAPVLKGTSTAWDYLQTLKNVFNTRTRPREIPNTIAKPSTNAPGTSLSEKDARLSSTS